MTTDQKIIKNKLGLLNLAQELEQPSICRVITADSKQGDLQETGGKFEECLRHGILPSSTEA
jgi:hypothetical protein